jgi:hypothetical protein
MTDETEKRMSDDDLEFYAGAAHLSSKEAAIVINELYRAREAEARLFKTLTVTYTALCLLDSGAMPPDEVGKVINEAKKTLEDLAGVEEP